MRLDPNPLFRRTIIPWYDGAVACWILIAGMLMVIGLSAIGISVSYATPEFQAHAWVPWTLLILASIVLLSVILRVVQRRFSERIGADPADEND